MKKIPQTIAEAHKQLVSKKITVQELVAHFVEAAKEKNPEINAYLEIYSDIDEQVKRAQEKIDNGAATLLTGIPLAIKDNILIEGRRAGAASKILEGYIAPYTATVIEKLDAHGPVYIGRTNMDEFAMGGSNETSAYGPVKNPHDTSRVPGGSSGGSAAAVAMGGALASLGSDTGGSIRQPASLCGLVGFKPTYGRISRHGLMALASSLDQIGPITHSVADAEALYDIMKGVDSMDSTTFEPTVAAAAAPVKKIGVPYKLFEKGLDEDIKKNFEKAIEDVKGKGYEIVDIDIPGIEHSLAVYYVIMPAEASSNLSRFDGVRFGLHVDTGNSIKDYFATRAQGFGKEVQRRIMLGTYVLSSGYYDAYYGNALKVRDLLIHGVAKAFEQVDVIMTPTSPTPAFKLGEKTGDPLSMYLSDIFTVTANLTGIPAISVPSGSVDRDGKELPAGVQFMAPHFREDALFSIGKKFLGEDVQ